VRASFLPIVLFLALLVGCDDNDRVAGRTPSLQRQQGATLELVDAASRRSTARVDGRAFSLVSQLGAPELEDASVQLSFAEPPRFQLKGCNYLEGTYALRDGRLTLTPEAISVMGCDARSHAWDRWLVEFFKNERPGIDTSGNTLILQTAAVRLVFAEQTPN
jgi:heat shock protein HslJ